MDLADHHGDTPLHLAAKTGNTAVAQKLLERNASVTARVRSGREGGEVSAGSTFLDFMSSGYSVSGTGGSVAGLMSPRQFP